MLDKDAPASPPPSRGSSRPRTKLSFAELLVELANAHERELCDLSDKLGFPGRDRIVYKGLSKVHNEGRHEKGIVSKIISKEPVTRPQSPDASVKRPRTPQTPDTSDEIRSRGYMPPPAASWGQSPNGKYDGRTPSSTKDSPGLSKGPPLPSKEPPTIPDTSDAVQLPNAVPDDDIVSKPKAEVGGLTTVAENDGAHYHHIHGELQKFTPEEEEKREHVIQHLQLRSRNKVAGQILAKWAELGERCQEPPRSGLVFRILQTTWFQVLSTMVIMLNAISTSIGAEQDMKYHGLKTDAVIDAIELACLCFYSFELVLKFYVHRLFFFWNDETAWGVFDLALVAQGWFEVIMQAVGMGGTASMGFARLLRLLKLSKIFRIFRAVKFLRDLRVMLMSVVSSFMAMIWAFVLLTIVMFMAALMFVQLQAGFLIELQMKGELHTIPVEEVEAKFGSVNAGMLSLFMATTGGVDWVELWDVLSYEPGGISPIALIAFIFFWHFSMLNVVTGIVMEKAVRNAQPDRDEMMMQNRKDDERTVKELTKLFQEMDTDCSGSLTMVEFVECLKVDEIADYFGTIGLSIADAEYFFTVLSETVGSDEVQVQDFIRHCTHMKGQAQSLDLIELAWEVQGIRRMLAKMPGVEDKYSRSWSVRQSQRLAINMARY